MTEGTLHKPLSFQRVSALRRPSAVNRVIWVSSVKRATPLQPPRPAMSSMPVTPSGP